MPWSYDVLHLVFCDVSPPTVKALGDPLGLEANLEVEGTLLER